MDNELISKTDYDFLINGLLNVTCFGWNRIWTELSIMPLDVGYFRRAILLLIACFLFSPRTVKIILYCLITVHVIFFQHTEIPSYTFMYIVACYITFKYFSFTRVHILSHPIQIFSGRITPQLLNLPVECKTVNCTRSLVRIYLSSLIDSLFIYLPVNTPECSITNKNLAIDLIYTRLVIFRYFSVMCNLYLQLTLNFKSGLFLNTLVRLLLCILLGHDICVTCLLFLFDIHDGS